MSYCLLHLGLAVPSNFLSSLMPLRVFKILFSCFLVFIFSEEFVLNFPSLFSGSRNVPLLTFYYIVNFFICFFLKATCLVFVVSYSLQIFSCSYFIVSCFLMYRIFKYEMFVFFWKFEVSLRPRVKMHSFGKSYICTHGYFGEV